MTEHPIKTISDLKPGDHLCLVYNSEADHRRVLTTFVRDGLQRGEKVMYFADEHTPAIVIDYLSREPILGRALQSNQLEILTADQVYLRSGYFDVDRTIGLLHTELDRALKQGYPALRVTGEVSWSLGNAPGAERFAEYESRVNEFFHGRPALALCQYKCDARPDALFRAILNHPLTAQGVSLVDNRAYVPPAEFLEPARFTEAVNRLSRELAWQPSSLEPARLTSADIDALLAALGLPPSQRD